ncbi:MAG: DUF4956 domain-containing protein [Lachnospiraceae bacterium]|nr:DUF4956 domain-containing protein [Lachnospiraceae bacterium]
MLSTLFQGIFDSATTTTISVQKFLMVLCISLLIGAFLAATYSYRNRTTKSFLITLFTLPAIVAVVIMMVNGNIGAGIAVAGAFSLVRFRSAPGTAKEISIIFLAMATGLISGMGYLTLAVLFAMILGCVFAVLNLSNFGETKSSVKLLKITIPEDLNYTDQFDDLFEKYTLSHSLLDVKTTNMGSLFKLSYNIELKDDSQEKKMIDELRCRNCNLEIAISRQMETGYDL